ncbi:MAG: cell division FtsA domain-containing protein [Bacillota bacterium]
MPLNENKQVFALDIGTRTVVGIVAAGREERLEILAQEMVEHQGRAMYDGQIHDIPKVAEAVARVKTSLEEATGQKLTEAAIAAAGRALETRRCGATIEVDPQREIAEETVRALEFSALRQARKEMRRQDRRTDEFYCVGHGVVDFSLDGLELTNLIGHRGRVAGVEVIATFLPASVVNSLFSVLKRVGLEPSYITLEPIAALEATIPEDLRMLNLALVDVGAGTSDIAVTKDGTVIGYGMVPIAGDEITEAIADICVVDFQTAETIKRGLNASELLKFTDILNNAVTLRREDIMAVIEPVVDNLAAAVSEVILGLNEGKAVRSVISVGGGAQTPLFLRKLALRLGLPESRVGVKSRAQLTGVTAPEEDVLAGPEGITVVGIAFSALKQQGLNLITVRVNGKEHRVFNPGDLRVVNCMSLLEYEPPELFGVNGRDLRFYVNGQETVVYGELARPATISVNGENGNLQTPVKDGDRIEVVPAKNGRDATARAGEFFADVLPVQVVLNGQEVSLPPMFRLNDVAVDPATEIREGDRLWMELRHSVGQLLAAVGFDPTIAEAVVDGVPVGLDYTLKPGDVVVVSDKETGQANNPDRDGESADTASEGLRVTVNGKEITITGEKKPLFIDVLRYLDFDLSQARGRIKILLNGRPAEYTEELTEGDNVEIGWE